MSKNVSGITKVGGREFRYNYDKHLVEWVQKADAQILADNEDWQKKFGKNLWDVDETGYVVVYTVGLREENWKNKEARMEYLQEWTYDIEEELAYM